nr:hypothetical protein [Duganella lactea]
MASERGELVVGLVHIPARGAGEYGVSLGFGLIAAYSAVRLGRRIAALKRAA